MVSTARINRIADELLGQARASQFGYTDPSGIPVPAMYQCEDLARLPQGLQSDIVNKASWAIGTSRSFVVFVLALMAGMIALHEAAPLLFGTRIPFPVMLSIAPLAPLLQVVLVRRAVRRIAARVAASWPGPVRPSVKSFSVSAAPD